jgi:L-arabinose isomerase
VRVVWRPVLTSSGDILRTILEAGATDRVVGVVAWMHTFSPAKMWIAGLDALRKPFLHLHTQANVELPWAEIDMDFMNLNQARTATASSATSRRGSACRGRPSPGTSRTRG